MALSLYDIVKSAVISSKAQKINFDNSKITLLVNPKSNKPMIKQAVEKFFDVKVEDVRIIVRQGKNRKVGKNKVTDNLQKKAIVKLKPGFSIDLFGKSEAIKEATKKQVENKKN